MNISLRRQDYLRDGCGEDAEERECADVVHRMRSLANGPYGGICQSLSQFATWLCGEEKLTSTSDAHHSEQGNSG